MVEPLADRYAIEPLTESRFTEGDVIDLWRADEALAPLVARRRVGLVDLVASAAGGGLAGVATIELRRVERMHADLFELQLYVAAEHRTSALGSHLTIASYRRLEECWESGEDRRGLGMWGEAENELVKRYRNQAVYEEIGMYFVGEGDRGEHLRVCWFPGAHAPPPPSRARR